MLWRTLASDAHNLLSSIQDCLETQQVTPVWTELRREQAQHLIDQMRTSWAQERVDLDSLWALKGVTGSLDLTGTVTCRAALEALHGHLQRIVELTGDELALDHLRL